MAYQSVNPYDGTVLKTFEELSDRQPDPALPAGAIMRAGWIENFGYGRKLSGELSSMGIQEFVNKKLVRVASIDAPA